MSLKTIRRVVTGVDQDGKSTVIWDGPAPAYDGAGSNMKGRTYNDLWVWDKTPAPLSLDRDDGRLPYDFPGPVGGGHLRVVQSKGKPHDYDPLVDDKIIEPHQSKMRPAGRVWDRGGRNAFTSDFHKTQSIDYAFILDGHRTLVLDDGEVEWGEGDIVIQVGAWHQWTSPKTDAVVAFDMIAADFPDGGDDVVKGTEQILVGDVSKLPPGVKPVRRIVSIDRQPGKSSLVSDGPSPDVRVDPARPGFASTRLWVTDHTPARIMLETLHLPRTIEPPRNGSTLTVNAYPPDRGWAGKVGAAEVAAFFASMGSPTASTYSTSAPHPYMAKTDALDFCCVLDGEMTLVLETNKIVLKKGEFVIVRGGNHAWSNHTDKNAVLLIASHSAER